MKRLVIALAVAATTIAGVGLTSLGTATAHASSATVATTQQASKRPKTIGNASFKERSGKVTVYGQLRFTNRSIIMSRSAIIQPANTITYVEYMLLMPDGTTQWGGAYTTNKAGTTSTNRVMAKYQPGGFAGISFRISIKHPGKSDTIIEQHRFIKPE